MTVPVFPVDEWLTTEQAVRVAESQGRKLESADLRKHCRERFAREGLAVLIDQDSIKTGPDHDYRSKQQGGEMSGRGIWLIHRTALEKRLEERARGPGHRSIWRDAHRQI